MKGITMDYKFTFEDGSEALAHHGVKGMKWGVWNAETRARHQGGTSKEAKRYVKGYDKWAKQKQKTERAADRYVANPSKLNERRFNVSANKEAFKNSAAAQAATRRNRNAYLVGGMPGYAIYNKASNAQKRDTALWTQHIAETRAVRLTEAKARAKIKTGRDATDKVLNKIAKETNQANEYASKAQSYQSKIDSKKR